MLPSSTSHSWVLLAASTRRSPVLAYAWPSNRTTAYPEVGAVTVTDARVTGAPRTSMPVLLMVVQSTPVVAYELASLILSSFDDPHPLNIMVPTRKQYMMPIVNIVLDLLIFDLLGRLT